MKNQGILELFNTILELRKTKEEHANSSKMLDNVLKLKTKLNKDYIFTDEEGDFIKLRKGIETHIEEIHDEINANLADWKLKLRNLQEEVEQNSVYRQNEDLRITILKTLSNIEDASTALNQRVIQNRVFQELLKQERELLEPSLTLQKLKMRINSEEDFTQREELFKEIEKEEKRNALELEEKYLAHQQLLNQHKKNSDNMGDCKQTDMNVMKNQIYPFEARCPNIYSRENPILDTFLREHDLTQQSNQGTRVASPVSQGEEKGDKHCLPLKHAMGQALKCLKNDKSSLKTLEIVSKVLEKNVIDAQSHIGEDYVQENLEQAYIIMEELHQLQESELSKREAEKELNKGVERIKLPKWDGTHETYNEFKTHQHELNQNQNKTLRFAQLMNSIKDKEVIKMIQYDKTFEKAFQTLDEKYGDTRTFIPKILKRIEDLDSYPKTRGKESENIQVIKNAYQELDSYDSLNEINRNFVNKMSSKLRARNRDEWMRKAFMKDYKNDEDLRNGFLEFIKMELKLNFQIALQEPEKSSTEVKKREFTQHNIKRTTMNDKRICYLCNLNHSIFKCPLLDDKDILAKLEEKKICTRCLRRPCVGERCGKYIGPLGAIRSTDCGNGCTTTNHQPLNYRVCGCFNNIKAKDQVKTNRVKNSGAHALGKGICLSEVLEVKHNNITKQICILYDPGSDTTLCKKQLRMVGKKVFEKNVEMQMADGTTKNLNSVPVIKVNVVTEQSEVPIEAIAVESLTETRPYSVKVPPVWINRYKMKPLIVTKQNDIDLLLGMDSNEYMPMEVERYDGLSLYKSRLSGNYLIGGALTKDNCVGAATNNKRFQTCRVKVDKIEEISKNFKRMVSIESVDDPLTNQKRMNAYQNKMKLAEDEMMKENIVYDNKTGTYTINLLHNEKLQDLEENYDKVLAYQSKMGKRLQKKPELQRKVNQVIQENIEKKFWVKADPKLLANPEVKRTYLPFQAEENVNSTSTPVRLVLNSSMKGRNNLSLNDTYKNGSCQIGDMKAIVLNLRIRPKMILADIRKFYTNFWLTEEEGYLHLVLIPVKTNGEIGFGGETKFEVYFQSRLTFGDSPSPTAATLARIKMAEMHAKDEKIKHIFMKCAYIDDVFGYCSFDEDVSDTIEKMKDVVHSSNMEFKKFYWSKMNTTQDEEDVELFTCGSTKALGYKWSVAEDKLKLKTNFVIEESKRREISGGITSANIESIMEHLTKREALSLTMSLYDSIGIFAPIALNLRLSMQGVFDAQTGWDDKIGSQELNKMKDSMREVLKMEEVEVPRCIIPEDYDDAELPMLIGFADAGEKALGYCIYIRHKLRNQAWEARILTAKAKTAGVRKLSIPRAELLAFQMLSLGVQYVLKEIEMKFSKVIMFTDSKVVYQQLGKSPSSFDTYTGTRLDLIQTIVQQHGIKVLHVKGTHNPADLCTKECTAEHMASSFWQNSDFLHLPEDQWPVYEDYLPRKVNQTKIEELSKIDLSKVFDTEKYRDLTKVKRIIARMLAFKYQTESFQTLMDKAQTILELDATRMNMKHEKKVFNQYRQWKDENNRIFLLNRGTENEAPKRMLLLDANTFLGRLVLLTNHDKWHGYGARYVSSKIREDYFLPQMTKRLSKIARDCFKCKLLHKVEVQQLMAPQKSMRLEMTAPFTNIMIDFCGPFNAVDEVKRRTKKKLYFLIVSCLSTRAINTVVCTDLSTDGFIMGLRNHIAVRGAPKSCHSDLGTNFIGSKRVILGEPMDLNIKQIEDFALNGGFTIHFGTPNHPEGQGAVEKSVDLFKKSLTRNHEHVTFTTLEWITIVAEITSLVNDRPLVLEPQSGEALTPNEILNWRPASKPLGPEVSDSKLTRRSFLQRKFVENWFQRYFTVMKERISGYNNKWRLQQENLRIGDIVLILDRPSVSKPYTLGRVNGVKPDKDGLVRTVHVEYRNRGVGRMKTLKRHVTSLALLISIGESEDTFLFPIDKKEKTDNDEDNDNDDDDDDPGDDNDDDDNDDDDDEDDPGGFKRGPRKPEVVFADDKETTFIQDI